MIKCLEKMLSEGDSIHSKYDTNLQHLGEGGSGQVALAENKVSYFNSKHCCVIYWNRIYHFAQKTKEKVAVKEISLRKLKKQNFHCVIVEIEVLKKLEHKNLVNFKDLYLTRRNGADILQVVMEFLNGGPLCNMADQLQMPEKHIATIVHEVSEKKDRIQHNKLGELLFG